MYKLIKPLIFSLNPELAHNIGVLFIKRGILSLFDSSPDEELAVRVANIDFPSPIGLAAGFDKNAEIFHEIFKIGFGFVEAGTVTPKPQYGNPKPRIFRLKEDLALINRLGFNNVGLDEFVSNIVTNKSVNNSQKIGANLGPNKDSVDRIGDYLEGIRRVSKVVDYITINVSSPNTENLRDFENSNIAELLKEIENNRVDDTPIFIKISPDVENKQISSVIEATIKHKMNGLIVSNTSKDRKFRLKSKNIPKDGGLSGSPILSLSNEKLSFAYSIAKSSIPIIGVGGVSSGADAYKKIKLGASLVQLYTSLIYEGPFLISKINNDLIELMKLDGVSSLSEVVGTTRLRS
ncbi:quinone-dependent dihydroorotate dehydrogenase [bacterium]|jgi:dihydroorotate dehydrogenase|nr:quinone-dependent dihydroorotate dehydrogenase [bacterium]MBT3794855.1 quinone-dependent dihydroorotate dehydrogenase [bacterium]